MTEKISFINSPMKYRQTDITTFFCNKKMKKYEKCKKIKSTYTTTVIINDSDSDFETLENDPPKNRKKKPRLPFPMSDDEDEEYENSSVSLINSNREVTSIPKKNYIQEENDHTLPNTSNNCSISSEDTIILNKSATSDIGQPKILQNLIISPEITEKKLSKNVKSVMQLNRPKKSSSNNEEFLGATSTPKKSYIQKENDEILHNTTNNNCSTSSDDTIILDKSTSSGIEDQKILSSPENSSRVKIKKNEQEDESIEEISQFTPKKLKKNDSTRDTQNSFTEQNFKSLNLKVEINLSMDSEMDNGNIATAVNNLSEMNGAPNSNSPTKKCYSTSKLTDFIISPTKISPSTSGQSPLSRKLSTLARKQSPLKKASKKLFDSGSPTREKHLGSPKKTPTKSVRNENQLTPKKNISVAKRNSTSPKTAESQIKPEEEDEKLNFKYLDSMKELFKNSLEDSSKRRLLLANDIDIIKEFLKMNVHYQFLLIKLFLYLPKWYNITKFCNKIKLDQKLSPKEVTTMYNYLKERKFVDTDVISLDVDVLLSMLQLVDLKRIGARFKIGKCKKKEEIITTLKKNCRTQSTLSSVKSTEDLLKDAAIECLGFCVKFREDIERSFYKAYLLHTFTNPFYLDPQKYLCDINYFDIIYPDYTVEGYIPFSNREQFTRFYDAVLLKKKYYDAFDKKNYISMKNLCGTVFKNLQNITSEGKTIELLEVIIGKSLATNDKVSRSFFCLPLFREPESISNVCFPIHCVGIWEQVPHLGLAEKDVDLLMKVRSNGKKFSREISDYLQRFSAEYQYISILKTAAKKLIKYHECVKTWLEFLVKNYPSHYALGSWYKQLAHILVMYEKDYELAAKIVIHAFKLNKQKDIFNLVELYELNVLATKIRTTKSYKVCALFRDELAELAELSIKHDHFPKKIIAGHTDRSGKSGKRTYSFLDENGEENFGHVEMIVLNDYQKEENYEGIHCEGRLLANLFALFFWDIIYCYVPNTFISKFQHEPLDMNTIFFYKNRKTDIDQRLEDIAQNWSTEKITKFLKENWDNHSHEKTITDFNLVTKFEELLRLFECINREVLSKIFRRLVTNFKTFHSGLPDLFLWNSDLSKCKFVEVKGEGDKLSHKQILWIQYLIDIGADVEVCHVSGVGSLKMKLGKVDDSSNNSKS